VTGSDVARQALMPVDDASERPGRRRPDPTCPGARYAAWQCGPAVRDHE